MAKLTIEDKRKIIEFHKEGFGYKVIAKKIGVNRARVQEIIRQHELFGDISLEVSHTKKKYTSTFKMELIQRVLNGDSIWQVSSENMISRGQIRNWITKYKEFGYNGLNKPIGRPKIMKPEIKKQHKQMKMKKTKEYVNLKNVTLS